MSKKVSLKERENLEHVCVCVVVFVSAMREREVCMRLKGTKKAS